MAAADSMHSESGPGTPDRKIRRALFLVKDRLTTTHRDRLQSLIDNAPEPVIGRDLSVHEKDTSEKFRLQAKSFLNNLPGITYQDAMNEVAKEEKSKTKKKKKPPESLQTPPTSPTPVKPTSRRSSKSPRKSVTKSPRKNGKKRKSATGLAEYLCLVDFMATCSDGPPPKPQEIIEFPAVLFNTRTKTIEDTFHCYIRPDVHPVLSEYCTELTGITQDMVDDGVSFFQALELHEEWLTKKHGLVSIGKGTLGEKAHKAASTYIYATCGDWDLKVCLANQLEYHNRPIPEAFQSWVNVKWPFETMYHQKVQGIADMLYELKVEPEDSKNQTGLDDCKSLAQVCGMMLNKGWKPTPTSGEGRIGSRLFWELQGKRPWPSQPDPVSPYKMVYLLRHGQSEAEVNAGGKRQSTAGNMRDSGLSERGLFEARAIQDIMTDEQLIAIEVVLCSPLKRAIHTALVGFPDHKLMIAKELTEIGRECPENSPRLTTEVLDELHDIIKDRSPGATIDYDTLNGTSRPLAGLDSPSRKVQKFFEWLYMDRREQTIAVVCHANVIRTAVYGSSTPLLPDNATPIKCQLFMNGNLVPV